mgnify:CR=1 FL=1
MIELKGQISEKAVPGGSTDVRGAFRALAQTVRDIRRYRDTHRSGMLQTTEKAFESYLEQMLAEGGWLPGTSGSPPPP